MKYWKRDGICGTMDDNGHVPGATETTKEEYDAFVDSIVLPPHQKTDIEKVIEQAKIHGWI